MENWSKNFTYDAVGVETPGSIEELQDLVATSPHVKPIGTRHSFNRCADAPGGLLVNIAALDLGLEVDRTAMTATVPAGWTYSRTVAALESERVALRNLASLPHISLAGGTATGTHGSGDTNQILSAEISGLELVDGEGEQRILGKDHPDLRALSVGMGAFGVLTKITLDVEPSYLVQQDYYRDTGWDIILDNLDEVFASAYSVNLHAKFAAQNVSGIWRKHRLDDDRARDVPTDLWGMSLVEGQLEAGKHTTLHEPGPWSDRLAHFLPESAPSAGGDELQSEYYVDRTHAVDAINALRAIGERIDPHLHGSEIRTIAADDLWLSPAYGRDTLSIGFTWKKHIDEVHALLPNVEEALAPFDARPHWGKLFAMGRDGLAAVFPHLDAFVSLAESYDPERRFANPYLENLRAK